MQVIARQKIKLQDKTQCKVNTAEVSALNVASE
jgi:hypothetical protein